VKISSVRTDVLRLSGIDSIAAIYGVSPMTSPYLEFWQEINSLIDSSELSAPAISRMMEAETDTSHRTIGRRLSDWRSRIMPPDSIAFLIGLVDVLGYEIKLVRKI
jgi:hypothetical protein